MTAMTPDPRWLAYLTEASTRAGTDYHLGQAIGLGDGSRISKIRRDGGTLSELVCVRLARWMGDDPLMVLRLAGHTEMADLLVGTATPKVIVPYQEQLKRALKTVSDLASLALTQVGTGGDDVTQASRRDSGAALEPQGVLPVSGSPVHQDVAKADPGPRDLRVEREGARAVVPRRPRGRGTRKPAR